MSEPNRQLHEQRVEALKAGVSGTMRRVAKLDDPHPMVISFDPGTTKCTVCIHALPLDHDYQKLVLQDLIRMFVAVERGDAAAFISSSWVRKVTPEDSEHEVERLKRRVTKVADDPKKVEMLMFVYMSQGISCMAFSEIDRSGDHPKLGEWEVNFYEKDDRLQGNFPDALRDGLKMAAELNAIIEQSKDEKVKSDMERRARELRDSFRVVRNFDEEE